jgi:membrane protease YdiL (CAAX protease family)
MNNGTLTPLEAPPVIPPAQPLPATPLAEPRPVPGFAQSLALCGIFCAASLPLQVILMLARVRLNMWTTVPIDLAVAWPLTIWVGLHWARTSFRAASRLKPFPARLIPALLLASFGGAILLSEAAGWIPMPRLIEDFWRKQAAEASRLLLFSTVVLVGPFAEEVFFRGQVLRGFLGRYSAAKAVWLSAILFAAFHLNPWQGVVALPLGLGCAWLVLRTGSTVPGMISHAMVNLSMGFLLSPLAAALGYSAQEMEARRHFPWPMLGIGAVAAAVGLLLLWRQMARATPLPAPKEVASVPT